MAVILTPVPTDPADLAEARNYLGPLVGIDGNSDRQTQRLDELMAVASAMIEREASAAPQAIKNEAVVRYAGYLAMSGFGAIDTERDGEREIKHRPNHAAMFLNSGAQGLLSPWKIRRAGAI